MTAKQVLRPLVEGGVCTCGATGEHLLAAHDATITERAEQAAGVPGELVASDEVLVLNCGPQASFADVGRVRADVERRAPALAGRVFVTAVQDIAVMRVPAAAEQGSDWEPEREPDSKTEPFNHRMCGSRHTVAQGCPPDVSTAEPSGAFETALKAAREAAGRPVGGGYPDLVD